MDKCTYLNDRFTFFYIFKILFYLMETERIKLAELSLNLNKWHVPTLISSMVYQVGTYNLVLTPPVGYSD